MGHWEQLLKKSNQNPALCLCQIGRNSATEGKYFSSNLLPDLDQLKRLIKRNSDTGVFRTKSAASFVKNTVWGWWGG